MRLVRGAAVAAAWLLVSAPAMAQVEWIAPLSDAATQITLQPQSVVGSADGAVYAAALANDGETTRVRMARISASGTQEWVRWVAGVTYGVPPQLFAHADGSATVSHSLSNTVCLANFSSSGVPRWRKCFDSYVYNLTLIQSTDDDLYLAHGIQRTIRKISALGEVRWSRRDESGSIDASYTNGVDSNGNFYELRGTRLSRWNANDGSLVSSSTLSAGYPTYTQNAAWRMSVARAGGHLVLARFDAGQAGQLLVQVERIGATGAQLWTRAINLPTNYIGSGDVVRLIGSDGDSVLLTLGRDADGEAHAARIAADGSVVWQTQYPRTRRFLETPSGIVAVRSVPNSGATGSDTVIQPLTVANGALGAGTLRYSRADLFVPHEWFAVGGGFAATFFGSNPVAPEYYYPMALSSATVLVSDALASPAMVNANVVPPLSVTQPTCLMPRLSASNPVLQPSTPASAPNAWWARTQLPAGENAPSDWSKVAAADGTRVARTAQPASGCGMPVTSDAGRVIIATDWIRAKRIDAAGATVWQATSSRSPVFSSSRTSPQSVSSADETTYVAGSIIGRVSANGVIAFETEMNEGPPRYIAVDAAKNTWTVSDADYGGVARVRKLSPSGEVLWSLSINPPTCSESVSAALLTTANEMLVAVRSCGEARLYKIGAAGQVAWQRVLTAAAQRPYSVIKALHVDASGNLYAGGCLSDDQDVTRARSVASIVASWSSSGGERWSASSDLIGNATECVDSVVTDASGNVFGAVSSVANNPSYETTTSPLQGYAPVLWSLTPAGAERWQHSGVLSAPFAEGAELSFDDDGKLVVLGEAPPGIYGTRAPTLRRINVSNLASGLSLKFLEVPAVQVEYRALFGVRIGLRGAGDVAAIAAAPVKVRLGIVAGTGALDGTLGCTIAAGASECAVSDLRYSKIEQGLILSAAADGFTTAVAMAIDFKTAVTTTTLTASPEGPYVAYSRISVRAIVQGSPAIGQETVGFLDGPRTALYSNPAFDCFDLESSTALLGRQCDFFARTSVMPITAAFSPYGSYTYSAATPLSLPVTKTGSSLQVTADPANTYIVGDRLRFRAVLLAANGVNVVPFVQPAAIVMSAGSCASSIVPTQPGDGYVGSYMLCEISAPAAGALSVSFNFAGDEDLLAATPVTLSLNVNAGAVIRGTYLPPGSPTLCSTTPGVSCAIDANTGEWRCVGPAGMSGELYFVPSAPGGFYNYPNTPVRYSSLTGLLVAASTSSFRHQINTCKPDVDGDGAVLAMTDGILILRRMLGLGLPEITTGATHACVPTAGKAYAATFALGAYDFDGDGQVLARTDGLLMLRYLLGVRGNALVEGALSATATRTTPDAVRGFFENACGLYPY